MNGIVTKTALLLLGVTGLASAQQKDGTQVMADVRAALGGEKLSAVRTLAASGRTLRTGPNGNTVENEFELALELPDKYRLRTALMAMGSMSIYRNSGFNGGQVIEEIDRPPNLSGGNVVIRIGGPGGAVDPAKMTPEQKAEANRQRLASNKRDFTRLVLGMFGASLAAAPLEFVFAGQAEAPDGKADVLDVRGADGFAARLFVDATTHLPLMVTWTDKEPLILQAGPGGTAVTAGGGGATFQSAGGVAVAAGGHGAPTGAGPTRMTPEELQKMEKDLEARRADAEAKRRTVEYRLYYSDYQAVGGVKLPHRVQRSIDGKTSEEMLFESYKVNARIDQGTFEPSK